MAGYNSDLMTNLALDMQVAGIGVYRPDSAFDPDETAIVIGVTPASPDRAITLMTYPVDDTDLTTVITGVQVKSRAGRNPLEVSDLVDAVYDRYHNRDHYKLGSIHVELSWFQSGAWIGQDSDLRMERVDNFYFRAERAAPNQIA